MNVPMLPGHAEMAVLALGPVVLYAAAFLGALWALGALVGMSPARRLARQLAPVRALYPVHVRTRPHDRERD